MSAQEHDLLVTALDRVLHTYAIAEEAQALADQAFLEDGTNDDQLRTLWLELKPDQPLPGLTGKHWQDVRRFFDLTTDTSERSDLSDKVCSSASSMSRSDQPQGPCEGRLETDDVSRRNVAPSTDFRGVGYLG